MLVYIRGLSTVLAYRVLRTNCLNLQSGKTQHQVTQFHIRNWNPQGKCSNPQTIISVIEEVSKVQRRTDNKPIVIHCRWAVISMWLSYLNSFLPCPSDTVSRSGMFCAIATTIDHCKTESVVDVFQVVKAQRIQKPGLVLTMVSKQNILLSLHVCVCFTITGAVQICVWSCAHIPGVLWDLLQLQVNIIYTYIYSETKIADSMLAVSNPYYLCTYRKWLHPFT